MKGLKKTLVGLMVMMVLASSASAQIKIEDILSGTSIDQILEKTGLPKIQIKKGFSPVFSIGQFQINKVGFFGEKLKGIGILGNILGKKQMDDINKLYKGYKTGLVAFKILAASGTAIALVGTAKGIANSTDGFKASSVKSLLVPGVISIATGVLTKLITKKASYKAVDMFNGVARKAIKDILSVKPASQNAGVGLYVNL